MTAGLNRLTIRRISFDVIGAITGRSGSAGAMIGKPPERR
jgi:hypothetical protein